MSLVGSKVSSLIVLEFILRAVSAWATAVSSRKIIKKYRCLHWWLLILLSAALFIRNLITWAWAYSWSSVNQAVVSPVLWASTIRGRHTAPSACFWQQLCWSLASFCSLWRHVAQHSKECYCGKQVYHPPDLWTCHTDLAAKSGCPGFCSCSYLLQNSSIDRLALRPCSMV